jgi:hypothetical protein
VVSVEAATDMLCSQQRSMHAMAAARLRTPLRRGNNGPCLPGSCEGGNFSRHAELFCCSIILGRPPLYSSTDVPVCMCCTVVQVAPIRTVRAITALPADLTCTF